MSFIGMNSITYIVLGLATWAHNLSQNQGRMSTKN